MSIFFGCLLHFTFLILCSPVTPATRLADSKTVPGPVSTPTPVPGNKTTIIPKIGMASSKLAVSTDRPSTSVTPIVDKAAAKRAQIPVDPSSAYPASVSGMGLSYQSSSHTTVSQQHNPLHIGPLLQKTDSRGIDQAESDSYATKGYEQQDNEVVQEETATEDFYSLNPEDGSEPSNRDVEAIFATDTAVGTEIPFAAEPAETGSPPQEYEMEGSGDQDNQDYNAEQYIPQQEGDDHRELSRVEREGQPEEEPQIEYKQQPDQQPDEQPEEQQVEGEKQPDEEPENEYEQQPEEQLEEQAEQSAEPEDTQNGYAQQDDEKDNGDEDDE